LKNLGEIIEELEKKVDHTDHFNYKTIRLDVFMKIVKEYLKENIDF